MSGNTISFTLFKSDQVSRRTMRYALGMVVMFALVFTFNWPGAFLVILLGNGFLLGAKPTLEFALDFVYKFALGFVCSLIITYLFIDYYLLFLPIMGMIMLYVYYSDASVLSPILKVALCILNMIVPLMWLKTPMLGVTLGLVLVIGAFAAILLTMIMFALIPDIEKVDSDDHGSHAADVQHLSKTQRFNLALKSVMALMPVIIMFLFFDMQTDALIIVYISLYAAMPDFANDFKLGKLMVKTTMIGGCVAFFMYEILVLIPMFSFFMLMVFGLALYAGHQMISQGKYALNIQKSFSAVIFIFGQVANNPDADAESKMWIRVVQMTVIVIYLVIAFRVLEMFFPETKKQSIP